ncbi:MAG: TIGR04282 family arsenosugar biosynthesis glycosyltransferase, partial [Gammaproteobacteria bacterium]|nr:TIGR04282 family arsenosugar biosynthesis glycosyltransferase [Gammaproteobacteria bacterium]
PNARLIIFAKAPLPGYCKTRLIPELGQEGAAQLQAELIENCLRRLCLKPICPTELWCSPDTQHPIFQSLSHRYGVTLHQQQGTSLGEKMHQAMACQDGPMTIIVGTDCPEITCEYVTAAFRYLSEGQDAVIGPAEDGGYVLLGLQRVSQTLFHDINWGTEQVYSQTVEKMKDLELTWREHDLLWDLDDGQDLLRYQRLKMRQVQETC